MYYLVVVWLSNVNISAVDLLDCLVRLISKMTLCVSSGMFNPTHSFVHRVVVTACRPPVKKRKQADKKLETRVRTYSASSTSSNSEDDLDTGLSLVDDETLALKLLTS